MKKTCFFCKGWREQFADNGDVQMESEKYKKGKRYFCKDRRCKISWRNEVADRRVQQRRWFTTGG